MGTGQAAQEPALLTIDAAHRSIGISRSTFKREVAAGRLKLVYVRARPYVRTEELERYIAERPSRGAL